MIIKDYFIIIIMQDNNIVIQRPLEFKPYEAIVLASDRCQVCFSKTDFQ